MLRTLALLLSVLIALHGKAEVDGVSSAKIDPHSPERLELVRLQVTLDRANFRPGKIDGIGGEFSDQAAERFRQANHLAIDAPIDTSGVPYPYREYTVTDEDFKWIGPVAEKPEEQARLKRLLYGNIWELVAEKFHCDVDFLHELNPDLKSVEVRSGMNLRVPDVTEFRLEDVIALQQQRQQETEQAKEQKVDAPVPKPNVRLILYRDLRLIELYENDKLIASFPCTPGSREVPVPVGDWHIASNVLMPDFRWDKGVLEYGIPSKEAHVLPPGPNNPVGIVWMGLNRPRVGMHGTHEPDQIGRNQSHGCIRTANWDALLITQMVGLGTPVQVK